LRKDNASEIVKFILKNPNTTQQRLADELNLHPSTIHWHTKLLIATRIISAKRSGKSVQYHVNQPKDMDKLLALAS
jgi:predicted transcriptional regulator